MRERERERARERDRAQERERTRKRERAKESERQRERERHQTFLAEIAPPAFPRRCDRALHTESDHSPILFIACGIVVARCGAAAAALLRCRSCFAPSAPDSTLLFSHPRLEAHLIGHLCASTGEPLLPGTRPFLHQSARPERSLRLRRRRPRRCPRHRPHLHYRMSEDLFFA